MSQTKLIHGGGAVRLFVPTGGRAVILNATLDKQGRLRDFLTEDNQIWTKALTEANKNRT